jgi:hypothetical protein
MSPDSLFILSLVAKMAVTALVLVVATFAAERAGALVGAMIATLPIAAGPAYIFLALEHDPDFIAQSALASLVANAANVTFALVYAWMAQRRGLLASVLPALAAWFLMAWIVRPIPWTTTSAILLNAAVFAVCLTLGNRFRHARLPLARRRWYDMPLRATMVAVLVGTVVAISAHVGPTITGMFAVFPIVLTSLMLILHPRLGGPATAAVIANSLLGLVGFSCACLTLHLAAVPLGAPAALALALALAVSIACNLAFWALRRGSAARAAGKH